MIIKEVVCDGIIKIEDYSPLNGTILIAEQLDRCSYRTSVRISSIPAIIKALERFYKLKVIE